MAAAGYNYTITVLKMKISLPFKPGDPAQIIDVKEVILYVCSPPGY